MAIPMDPKTEMSMQKLGIKQKIYKPAKLKTQKGDLGKNGHLGGQKNKRFHTKVRDKGI